MLSILSLRLYGLVSHKYTNLQHLRVCFVVMFDDHLRAKDAIAFTHYRNKLTVNVSDGVSSTGSMMEGDP